MNRRRWIVLLLVLALAAVWLALPAGAVDLAFVAVNDTIPLTLSGSSLPFYSSGVLYVPYTIFSQLSLGFYPSYVPEGGTLTMFSRNQRLVYNLVSGTVTDEDDTVSYLSAVTRGGVVFLPAAFTANHFGVQCSTLLSADGYRVIRFTTGSQVYDDSLFIEKAENLISYRVEQFVESQEPAAPDTPAETVTPSQEPDPPEEEQTPPEIYLAVVDASTMEDALAQLEAAQVPAAFFLTAAEIAENGELVRRIEAAGHTVGLTVESGEDVEAGLSAANEALDRVLGRKTLVALVSESDAAAVEGRYCLFARPSVRLTASEAAEAFGETCLYICDGSQLEAGLPILEAAEAVFSQLTAATVLAETR